MKTILVTGGAGYIGSHYVYHVKDKFNIIVVDNFSESKNNIIKNRNIIYENVDIRDKNKLEKIFVNKKIDAVIHFAALANVPNSVKSPADYYSTNIIGGITLLNCMVKYKVSYIVFSSSAAVYGEPKTNDIKEDHPKNPTNPYGQTKLMFEQVLLDYHKAYGISSLSFRYFCAAGCDESLKIGEYHNPETHVIPCLIKTVLGKQKQFFVYGNDYSTPDGTGIRDYIHVNDLVQAHQLGLDKLFTSKALCQSFNLGINRGFSVMELIKAIEKISGKKVNYQISNRRPGDPSRLVANSQKAHVFLKWKPKYLSIENIMKTAYFFLKSKI